MTTPDETAARELLGGDRVGEGNCYAARRWQQPCEELVTLIAAALHAARAEERERAAKIAEGRESPWGQQHPTEKFISRLQGVILQAVMTAPRDEDQPERHIALAVFEYLRTGLDHFDRLFDGRPISAAIRGSGEGR